MLKPQDVADRLRELADEIEEGNIHPICLYGNTEKYSNSVGVDFLESDTINVELPTINHD